MALIGELEIGTPVGQQALEAAPDMVLEIEDIRSLESEPWTFLFWAYGGEFETYESALADDPTVATYDCLTVLPDRRLYRVELSKYGQENTLYPVAVGQNIITISLTMTSESVEYIGRFPSREALLEFIDECKAQNRTFTLCTLYEEESTADDGTDRYGVTASQREVLLTALEQGYFDVPRESRMADIAAELEISTSAVSAQLRRGQQSLLRQTLANTR